MPKTEIKLVRKRSDNIVLRTPRMEDGADIWRLIRSCGPLDENSLYCNLLQCDHFGDTCVVAERDDGTIVGWVSAYLLPDDPETLFIWQVAVDKRAQGAGLGKRMLNELLERDACAGVAAIKTTITSDNAASWGLFSSFTAANGGKMRREPHFRKHVHFEGEHDTEHMLTISFSESARDAA